MESPWLRIRIIFDECSILTTAQRSNGMSHTWLLIQPNQYPKISDVSNHLLHKFNLQTSCPTGILLYMEGFVLLPSESTRILKDNDIICLKRKRVASAADVEKSEEEASLFKKRKASTKPRSSKKKKQRVVGVEDEVATENSGINKKSKSNKEKRNGESETFFEKVKSRSKVKRKKKNHEIVTCEIKNVDYGEYVIQENIKPTEENEMVNAETSDQSGEDDDEGVEQTPTAHLPLIYLIDFEKLSLYTIPKVGDVIAYRIVMFSSPLTTVLSSFRVGKISHYDDDCIVLMPVPEYPIVFDKMDEDDSDSDNSLYNDNGSLLINFSALADLRILKKSKFDAVKVVSNGVNKTAQVNEKNTASKLTSSGNGDEKKISKDSSPVVGNREGNIWNRVEELLTAKKSELLAK